MKAYKLTIAMALFSIQLCAQEVMKVEFKNGNTVEYPVNDVNRVYFETNSSGNTVTVSPTNLSLYYGDTYQLSATNATSWYTNNDFVATVDNNGLVTGGHIGSTQIVASNGSSNSQCNITIVPKYNSFDTPILDWTANITSIQNRENHTLLSATASALGYNYQYSSTKCVAYYSFKNGVLSSVLVAMPYTYADYVNTFGSMMERYQPAGESGGMYMFMDAMQLDNANTVVAFFTDGSGSSALINVMYVPNTSSSAPNMLNSSQLNMSDMQEEIKKVRMYLLEKQAITPKD